MVQSALGLVFQYLPDNLPDLFLLLAVGVPDNELGKALLDTVLNLQLHVLRQALLQQRLFQRRFVGAAEHLRQGRSRHGLFRLIVPAKHPAPGQNILVFVAFLYADFVHRRSLFGMHRGLQGDGGVHLQGVVGGKEAVQLFQHRIQIHLAVQKNPSVGGVVKLPVAGLIIFVSQAGDGFRVAPGFQAVAVIGKQQGVHLPLKHRVPAGVHPLHLVVHHPVVGQLPIRGIQLVVPALLAESVGVGDTQGMEHRIQVDVHQVEEVLVVPRA